ncbi:MAG: glycosyltransferase family 4 protein [Jatrophihabitans sp.]|uniref:glycosyltransferase family 4 protein n=1 Tax=Jatrophihabitans sp. TaxID=1932789 RepID=UPI003F813BF6
MRIALIAETFTPAVNGVVNSVLQTADNLARRGHTPVVVAPSGTDYNSRCGARIRVVRMPSMTLPGYRQLAVARPLLDLAPVFDRIRPDVVHLASPAVLGAAAVRAADECGLPTVAVYQTDLAAFARRYGLAPATPWVWAHLRRLHNAADLTLVPSSASQQQLARHGIGPLARWGRGVDTQLFTPRRADADWRSSVGGGRLVVGFVGRLAPEKRVHLLAGVSRLPGVQLVVVGDGPTRASLERLMPDATFTGQLVGRDLARVMASLDLLVHPGADETFCQVVQEALCSGVPVVAAASGGPLDLVTDGRTGRFWRGDDVAHLETIVAALRDDRPTLAAMAAQARPSVVHRTWGRITDELLGHYRDVIDRRDRLSAAS